MNRAIALAAVGCLLLASCVSEQFVLNGGVYQPNTLYGLILTEIDSVEVERLTSLRVHSGGMAALRNYGETQTQWTLFPTLVEGTETIYRVRTVPIEGELTPSIDLVYSTTGAQISEAGRLLVRNDTVRAVPGAPEVIRITNDGKFLTVVIGCTELYHGPVTLPSTEWLVVESPSGSEVVLARVQTEETR